MHYLKNLSTRSIDKVYIDGSYDSKTVAGVLKKVSHVTHFCKDMIPMRSPHQYGIFPNPDLWIHPGLV